MNFRPGEGVGTVTKPGLAIPPGEAAINPVPRQMIRDSVREVTDRAVRVTVSIPDGEALAAKTFNPKLGVRGGLSILGTTGRVRPFSCPALQESLRCALQVALALGLKDLVFVPGHIGEKAAHRHFVLRPEQVIEVSNEWGYMLGQAAREKVPRLLVLGHPGKLVKLAEGMWDTHSSRSGSALPLVEKSPPNIFPPPSGGQHGRGFSVRLAGKIPGGTGRHTGPAGTTGGGTVYRPANPYRPRPGQPKGRLTGRRGRCVPMGNEPHPIVIVGCGPGSSGIPDGGGHPGRSGGGSAGGGPAAAGTISRSPGRTDHHGSPHRKGVGRHRRPTG